MDFRWQNPFDGAPAADHVREDNGNPHISVTAAAVGPWRAKAIDLASLASSVSVGCVGLYQWLTGWNPSIDGLVGATALPIGVHYGLKFGLRLVFSQRVQCAFTTRRFGYQGRLWW